MENRLNADTGKEIAEAIDKRIIDVAKQVWKGNPSCKWVQALVVGIKEDGYTIKINNVKYENVKSYIGNGLMAVNDVVDVLIPNNNWENMVILGKVAEKIIQEDTNTSEIAEMVETQRTTLVSHESRITTLETNSSGTVTPNYYGTTIEDFSRIEEEMLCEEEIFNNGGKFCVIVNHKGSNGPKTILFTRINPKFNPRFIGTIRLCLTNIPQGQTNTTLTLQINNEPEEIKNVTFSNEQEFQVEIPFDFYTSKIANTFKIKFSDNALANTILEYVEMESANQNFLLLNRDYNFNLSVFHSKSETASIDFCMIQIDKNNKKCYEITTENIPPLSSWSELPLLANERINLATYHKDIKKNTDSTGGGIYSHNYWVAMVGENNGLFFYREDGGVILPVTAVMVGHTYRSWRDNGNVFTAVDEDKSIVIGTTNLDYVNKPTFNGEEFPKQFIQFDGVQDCYIFGRYGLSEIGYVLMHETGEILFIDKRLAHYFIKIGVGTQPRFYVQANDIEIHCYYKFNGNIIMKTLQFNSTTNKWLLTNKMKVFPNCKDIFETGGQNNKIFVIRDDFFQEL